MKKLHLSLESLKVDSFTTDEATELRGTVQGASIIEPTGYTYCIPCGGTETGGAECYTQTQKPRMTCGGPAMTCGPYTE